MWVKQHGVRHREGGLEIGNEPDMGSLGHSFPFLTSYWKLSGKNFRVGSEQAARAGSLEIHVLISAPLSHFSWLDIHFSRLV